jgi:hypothetical protein
MSRREPFDPFDDRHRDKPKRRKSSEIAFEKKQWEERIDNHFRRAMDEMKKPDGEWPTYVQSTSVIYWTQYSQETNLPERVLRRHTTRSMGVLGYERVMNPDSKEGRFRVGEEKFFLFVKRGAPMIVKEEIKILFGE